MSNLQMDPNTVGWLAPHDRAYNEVVVDFNGDGVLPMTVLPPSALQVDNIRPEYYAEVRSVIATLKGLQDAVQYENRHKGLPGGDITEAFSDACETLRHCITHLGIRSDSTYFDHAYHAELTLAAAGFPITYTDDRGPLLYVTQSQFIPL